MSDAITLDVLSSSPVQLDAGDADPIAREEIAELTTRVTTVEGDVSGLSTRVSAAEGDVTALDDRMDAAEGDISTLGTTVDGIDARVEAIEADGSVTTEKLADGAVTDAKLVQTGGVLDRIDNVSEYGAKNTCPIRQGTFTPGRIVVVADGSGRYTVSGTAASNTHFEMYINQNAFPDEISAGDTILAHYDTTNAGIVMYVCWYVNGVQTQSIINRDEYKSFSIPSDANGMQIRLTVLAGTTCDNDVFTPFVFIDKTKHEYNVEIDTLSDSVNQISAFMPRNYVPQAITLIAGLVNRWNQVAGTSGYFYAEVPVTNGELYKVSGNFYGGNYPAYLILSGDSVLSYYNPEASGAFTLEVSIPDNATELIVNGSDTSPVAIAKYEMVAVNNMAKSYDSVLVGKGDSYSYNDINSAIVANASSVISVDYGSYETEIQDLSTDKSIIGKDKNLCILNGTNRDYETPPIEISGGIIKHFTVNMVNADDATHKGYCLHSDTSSCIGKTLVVEDCKFTCTGQHSVGMGIWQSESVLYKNCEFVFSDTEQTPTLAPFFAHNSGTQDGVAIVRFHNCIFRGSGYALKLSSYSSNCTMRFEFINCTFASDTLTGNEMIWTDYVTGDTHDQNNLHRFSGKMPLLPTSHGNNVGIANYTS